MKNKHKDYGIGIPQHEIEALVRVLLPDIQAFFASEEGMKEYLEWEASQAKESNPKNRPLK